jgi:hypothetical protein
MPRRVFDVAACLDVASDTSIRRGCAAAYGNAEVESTNVRAVRHKTIANVYSMGAALLFRQNAGATWTSVRRANRSRPFESFERTGNRSRMWAPKVE